VRICAYVFAIAKSIRKPLLPGYRDTLTDSKLKERYDDKTKVLNGKDPYKMPPDEWKDDLDFWPAVTYIHLGFYLLHSPSPYTKEDLMNYKMLESYQ
jgi:hypothetical protein